MRRDKDGPSVKSWRIYLSRPNRELFCNFVWCSETVIWNSVPNQIKQSSIQQISFSWNIKDSRNILFLSSSGVSLICFKYCLAQTHLQQHSRANKTLGRKYRYLGSKPQMWLLFCFLTNMPYWQKSIQVNSDKMFLSLAFKNTSVKAVVTMETKVRWFKLKKKFQSQKNQQFWGNCWQVLIAIQQQILAIEARCFILH